MSSAKHCIFFFLLFLDFLEISIFRGLRKIEKYVRKFQEETISEGPLVQISAMKPPIAHFRRKKCVWEMHCTRYINRTVCQKQKHVRRWNHQSHIFRTNRVQNIAHVLGKWIVCNKLRIPHLYYVTYMWRVAHDLVLCDE